MNEKSVPAFSDKIIELSLLEENAYRVVIDIGEGRAIETVVRISLSKLRTGEEIRCFNFEGEEYHRDMFAGNLNFAAIIKQIGRFHDTLNSKTQQEP
jgi:hypothetical protein